MNATSTGTFIATLRKEQGLTQHQLAERLLVSDKAISRWETGRGLPDLDNLEALSVALGVSIPELLRGERIEDPKVAAQTEEIATDGFSLVRDILKRRTVVNVVMGFLAGLVVVALAVAHLTAPITLPYHDGLVTVEELADGRLLASAAPEAQAIDVEEVASPDADEAIVSLSCRTTLMAQLMGTEGSPVAVIGDSNDVDAVAYYPGTPDDVLLYGEMSYAGMVTLPRLVYNMWLALGVAASALGLVAYALLRKRWFGRRVLQAALVPICLTVSLVAVLWGHFGAVYDAQFYLSGICLVAAALYAIASLALSRRK